MANTIDFNVNTNAVTVLNQTDTQVTLSGLTPNERVAVKGLAALKAKWQEAEE